MKNLYFVAACLAISTGALAHPREDALQAMAERHAHPPVARSAPRIVEAMTDAEPRARIRGDNGKGLTQAGFARWISRHPHLIEARRTEPTMWVLTSSAPPARMSDFAIADSNHDCRVSAAELADFLSGADNGVRL